MRCFQSISTMRTHAVRWLEYTTKTEPKTFTPWCDVTLASTPSCQTKMPTPSLKVCDVIYECSLKSLNRQFSNDKLVVKNVVVVQLGEYQLWQLFRPGVSGIFPFLGRNCVTSFMNAPLTQKSCLAFYNSAQISDEILKSRTIRRKLYSKHLNAGCPKTRFI